MENDCFGTLQTVLSREAVLFSEGQGSTYLYRKWGKRFLPVIFKLSRTSKLILIKLPMIRQEYSPTRSSSTFKLNCVSVVELMLELMRSCLSISVCPFIKVRTVSSIQVSTEHTMNMSLPTVELDKSETDELIVTIPGSVCIKITMTMENTGRGGGQ